MSFVLGICNDETSSACILSEKALVAAASEERFTRVKADTSWPTKSIEFCLDQAGVGFDDLQAICYSWVSQTADRDLLSIYASRIAYEASNNPNGLSILQERIETELIQDKTNWDEWTRFISDNGISDKVFVVDHHEAHAFSAFSFSPFDDALVVTADGRGDFISLTVSFITSTGAHEILYRATSADSLGFFYGRITSLLGFRPHRHEGKVSGLAAHGNPKHLLGLMDQMISVKDGQIYGQLGEFYRPFYSNFSESLVDRINAEKPEDVAAAAQQHLEDCVTKLVRFYLDSVDTKNICLAGGVFANVKVNHLIREMAGVDNIFVQPQMGDGGLCLGSAAKYRFATASPKITMRNMYLGPRYSSGEIGDILAKEKTLRYTKPENCSHAIVDLLTKNVVVGLFQGRMEFGPRALCNRSIIYHCKDKTINQWLNQRMDRTEFMPFAPVTLKELGSKCYLDWEETHISSEYMTATYYCTEFMMNNCPATVHVDGTARPQIITKENNPFMHKLLKEYFELTGEPALINTSFNRHEEPIVLDPHHALAALKDGMIDALAIEDFLVFRD